MPAASLVHRFNVEGLGRASADDPDQVQAADRTDLRRPLVDGQRPAAVRIEYGLPGREHRALGVEDQPVEVEDDGVDHWADHPAAGMPMSSTSTPSGSTTVAILTSAPPAPGTAMRRGGPPRPAS